MQGIDRTRRVAELIRRALSSIIRHRLSDSGLELLSITATEVTKDLKRATVFVTLLGGKEDQEKAIETLNDEVVILRRDLSASLNLRHTPIIEFRYDSSIEHGVRLNRLIDDLALNNGRSNIPDE
jgi:ribosome-binding factor A